MFVKLFGFIQGEIDLARHAQAGRFGPAKPAIVGYGFRRMRLVLSERTIRDDAGPSIPALEEPRFSSRMRARIIQCG